MKRYQLIAIVLIMTAVALGIRTYTNRPDTDYISTGVSGNPDAEQDTLAASSITWKTFTTLSTDSFNVSFDYPEGSTIEEGANDSFQAYAIVKDGKRDVVVMIIDDANKDDFVKAMTDADATQSTSDRGVTYRGVPQADSVLAGLSDYFQTMPDVELALFIPDAQYSPGFTSMLIDIGADWNPDVLDYLTRTFAFIVRE